MYKTKSGCLENICKGNKTLARLIENKTRTETVNSKYERMVIATDLTTLITKKYIKFILNATT